VVLCTISIKNIKNR